MNPFSSDKAPYAIALLISAIGWVLATFHGSVQSSEIVAYRVTTRNDEVVLRVTNLSKVKSLDGVSLALICPNRAKCLQQVGKSGEFARARAVPPVAAPVDFIVPSAQEVSFTTSLAPGARVEIVARKASGAEPPKFYLLPGEDRKARGIYVVSARNPFAWFVAHYYLIMTAISLALAAGFVAWLVLNLLTFLRPAPPPPATPKEPG